MFPAPVTDSETIMLHAHTLNSKPAQVTVKFGDAADSFLLAAGDADRVRPRLLRGSTCR